MSGVIIGREHISCFSWNTSSTHVGETGREMQNEQSRIHRWRMQSTIGNSREGEQHDCLSAVKVSIRFSPPLWYSQTHLCPCSSFHQSHQLEVREVCVCLDNWMNTNSSWVHLTWVYKTTSDLGNEILLKWQNYITYAIFLAIINNYYSCTCSARKLMSTKLWNKV